MTRGMSLIEVVLAAGLLALLLATLVGGFLYGAEASTVAGDQARATMLAEEALEAVRNIRDAGWSGLPADGTYGLATTSNQWNLALGSDTIGVFTRTVALASVDANRKTVTATVSWSESAQRTGQVTLSTRLTNWQPFSGSGGPTITVNPDSVSYCAPPESVTYDPRANDTTSSGTITISSVTAPAHGTALVNSGTSITYTRAAEYYGADSFTYTATNGSVSGSAQESITIQRCQTPPVAVNDSYTTKPNTAITFDPRVNDYDTDGDTLTITAVGKPGHGSAKINSGVSITYTPNFFYTGTDSFTYTISDGHGYTASATITIKVSL